MPEKKPITSGELGTLWVTYLKDKMMLRMLDYFLEKEQDDNAKNIISAYYNNTTNLINDIEVIFKNEGAAIPAAFSENDVHKDALLLWDNYFDIFFLHSMMKVSQGFNSLHISMSYRKDIRDIYKHSVAKTTETFDACTDFLLEKGILPRPPFVSMPKESAFIEQKSYTNGIRLFGNNRSLNTVELAYLYNTLEVNILGTQLMTGFAQSAKEKEVRDYFIKGKELAKKIVSTITQIMQQSDIQAPSTWAGRATDSVEPPYSDKMIMYCSTLLSSFALGNNAMSTALSIRTDLPPKLMAIMKDIYQFTAEGGRIMIKHMWLEEPPQMEDRNQLTKSKK